MFTVLLGIYVFFLTLIAVFFILIKIHAYKYKKFSDNIEKYTKICIIILIISFFAGIIFIFKIKNDIERKTLDNETSTESVYY